ncbi:ABC transporter substrate-binding protein [Methanolobus sp. ZRKC2]|uniref:ABC transporter substrate-binding protein n=1 Tax=Methanolobus sp. ZRKC2 TaxID=3125783 RepID=UPI0032447A78
MTEKETIVGVLMDIRLKEKIHVVILSCLLMVLSISTASAAIPGDLNNDHSISREELSDAIIFYMKSVYVGEDVECLEKDKLRETARKHFTITVTDISDREVTVPTRIEKVVLGHALYIQEFAALEGENFTDKIVGWGTELEVNDIDTYEEYLKKYPEIEEIPKIGCLYKNTFDTEAIVALEPDVVIMPLMLSMMAQEDIERLENAGIPVLIVDFWKNPLENTQESILLMGQVLDREQRAESISDFYGEQMDHVYSVLNNMDTENVTSKKVYVEFGSYGPSQYGMTFDNSNWGPMITTLEGTNVAEGVETMTPIDPEYLLAENPDLIVIAGQYWPESEDSMVLGYSTNQENSLALLQGFCTRPGWDTLTAVENNDVHAIHHGISYHIYNYVGMQAFAKWMYPEEFADMNPEANLIEFHDRFLPIDYNGVWILDVVEA